MNDRTRPGELAPATLEQLLRYLDGRLEPDQLGGLVARLRDDPGARREAARLLLQTAYLHDLSREERALPRALLDQAVAAAGVQRGRGDAGARPRFRRRWLAGAVASAAIAASAMAWVAARRWPAREVSPASPGSAHLTPAAGPRAANLEAVPGVVPRVSDDAGQALRQGDAPPASVIAGKGAGMNVMDRRPLVLLIRGPGAKYPTEPGDSAITRRLESLGFDVRLAMDEELQAADIADKALVVISASATATVLEERLRTVPLREAAVPVVVCEPLVFDDLAMTGPTPADGKFSIKRSALTIARAEHPLAAGLQGTVRVSVKPVHIGWGRPTEAAIGVATLADLSERFSVFAYERGVPLVGLQAPARRVGFFFHPNTPAASTDAGWQLFDAAIRWATAAPEPGPIPR